MRFRVVLFGFLFLAAQSGSLKAKDARWFEISSEHFLLFTDTNEAKGRRLVSDFENRAAVLAQALGKIPARQFPIEIFLFSNEPDFIEVLPHGLGEEQLRKSAFLLRGPDRIFVVAKDKSPDDIANDAGHAVGHVLFERYVMWRPFWLAEAAAEYFRKAGRSPDTKAIPDEDRFSAADLVTIVPSATYNDNDLPTPFRTESYRFLRLLENENPDVLRQFVQSLRAESEAAPKLSIDLDGMESKLKSYAETLMKAPPVVAAVKSAEADPARLAIHRGDLLLATERQSEASRLYNADSKDARAARAILTRFSRPAPEAVRVLERASRELPESGLVQYHFGAMIIDDKKDIQSQVAALERAVQVLPLMGRAHAELARVYALSGQAEKSLALTAKAIELEPEFADHFFEIRADAQLALGETAKALHDVNIASDLPHADRSTVERYLVKVSTIRRRIEAVRREGDQRDLDTVRNEVIAKAAEREPPPKPAPPPPPVPQGSIGYEIETRAPIEVVRTSYPDYPEALRRKGAAGKLTVSVDIGPDGKVKTATVANSTIPDMNNATVEALKKWSFNPGNRSIRVVFTFTLQ